MEINKLSTHLNNQINSAKSETTNEASKASKIERSSAELSDNVSLSNNGANKTEELFAKIEMEKLNHSSFEKLKGMKAKLQEYEAAKGVSDEAAKDTDIGKMLNDPEVWGKIAQNIIDK
ncbi:MAG: hypothetical protein WD357_09200 [Gracilimonas sp.]